MFQGEQGGGGGVLADSRYVIHGHSEQWRTGIAPTTPRILCFILVRKRATRIYIVPFVESKTFWLVGYPDSARRT